MTLIAALLFAAVHVASPWLVFLDRTPRSIWLSTAGGISVAYVFVHLLPELATLSDETRHVGPERWIWLLALAGFVAFYGLERLARRHAPRGDDGGGNDVVWALHLGSFAIYNFAIGYLLDGQAQHEGTTGVLTYAVALGLHFIVNDRALAAHHDARYRRTGRWVLAAAVLAGWAVGLLGEIPEAAIATAIAVLAGGIVLNVVKEELPAERESRFWAFALGTAGYAAVLLAA